MTAPTHTRPAPADELVEVVVARGNSVIDNTGAQILAGQTAKVLTGEVQRLIECGAIVDPADRAAPSNRGDHHKAEGTGAVAWNVAPRNQGSA